jgi:leucyl-tRNA synthetase
MISLQRLQSLDFRKLSSLLLVLAMLTSRSYAYSASRAVLPKWSSSTVQKLVTSRRLSALAEMSLKSTVAVRDKSPFFISTPIYYVNGQPHLGHAYTSVISDIIARFQRADGREVFFLTGTDEHGQKVEQSALAAGKTPIQFADEVSSRFRELVEALDCSHDDFIRTTEDRHKAAVAKLWEKLLENGQIYLGAYEGW